VRVRPADHRLHREAVEVGLRRYLRDARTHGQCRHPNLDSVRQIERDSADIGLVRDVRRQDLQRHRKADRGRGDRRLVRVGHGMGLRHRDAVGGKEPFRFGLGEPLPAARERALDHGTRGRAIRNELLGHRGRRLHQRPLAVAVADQVHEGEHRLPRRLVHRQAIALEQAAGLVDGSAAADPAGDQRLVRPALRRFDHRLGGIGAGSDAGRAVQHQDRVDARILEQDAQGIAVALARRVPDDVDRIAAAPGGGQRRAQALERRGREFGEMAALVDQRVGGDHPEAAAVARDGETVAFEGHRGRQDLGGVEQLLERAHAQHAGAPERGAIDLVGAGERTGVRCDGSRALGVPASLEHDHRLAPACRARRGHELPGVGRGLHVEQDGGGGGLLREVVEQVAEVEVGHVADRDEVGEADAASRRPVEDAGHDRAGLGDEREPARRRGEMREGGIQALSRHHDAEAVGANDAQQMRARRGEHGLAQRVTTLRPAFAEPCADDDGGSGAARPELGDDRRHRRRRCHHHREIGRRRQARYVRMAGRAVDLGVFRVYQHDRAGKSGAAQIARDDRAWRQWPLAGTDQRHRCRLEQAVQVAHRHALILACRPEPQPGTGRARPIRCGSAVVSLLVIAKSSCRPLDRTDRVRGDAAAARRPRGPESPT
jgi:hypothetical protein